MTAILYRIQDCLQNYDPTWLEWMKLYQKAKLKFNSMSVYVENKARLQAPNFGTDL